MFDRRFNPKTLLFLYVVIHVFYNLKQARDKYDYGSSQKTLIKYQKSNYGLL